MIRKCDNIDENKLTRSEGLVILKKQIKNLIYKKNKNS
jgi:hypothetical protein